MGWTSIAIVTSFTDSLLWPNRLRRGMGSAGNLVTQGLSRAVSTESPAT
jgi:hypothetical protein